MRGIAQFAYVTGWRVNSEVVPPEWRQVHLAGGTVRLEPGMGKTGDPRTFPITKALHTLLEAQRKLTNKVQRQRGKVIALVFHQNGDKIKRFDKTFKVAATAAGLPATIPHDLRRCGVRNLVRAGIPEHVAMQMTGHKTRSVFERYNIVSEGDFKDAARKIDGVPLGMAARSDVS